MPEGLTVNGFSQIVKRDKITLVSFVENYNATDAASGGAAKMEALVPIGSLLTCQSILYISRGEMLLLVPLS